MPWLNDLLEVTIKEVAGYQGPDLPSWFIVKPSLWLETKECIAVTGRGEWIAGQMLITVTFDHKESTFQGT